MTLLHLTMLVLLRAAIGWHFLYEGIVKIESRRADIQPWTSEWYLKSATGPLAPYFKRLADPDPCGLKSVSPYDLQRQWREEADRFTKHYRLDPAQAAVVEASTEQAVRQLEDHFRKRENWEQLLILRQEIADWIDASSGKLLTHQRNELNLRREELEKLREEIAAPIREIESKFKEHVKSILTSAQAALGPPPEPIDTLEIIDRVTMWGLTLVGLALLIGLFSRLSALGAAGFLVLFYLAIPPWPGLPVFPSAEGSYLIVNKNLVELIACLVLVTVPTGKWIGLDALIAAISRRGRSGKSHAERNSPAAAGAGALSSLESWGDREGRP